MFNLVIDYFIENLTGIKNSQVKKMLLSWKKYCYI